MLTTTRERRTFMRMVIDAPVTLSDHMIATCRELAANGMAIEVESSSHFVVGEKLKISLSTNSNALPPFVADAKVVRVEKNNNLGQLGVEFISAS